MGSLTASYDPRVGSQSGLACCRYDPDGLKNIRANGWIEQGIGCSSHENDLHGIWSSCMFVEWFSMWNLVQLYVCRRAANFVCGSEFTGLGSREPREWVMWNLVQLILSRVQQALRSSTVWRMTESDRMVKKKMLVNRGWLLFFFRPDVKYRGFARARREEFPPPWSNGVLGFESEVADRSGTAMRSTWGSLKKNQWWISSIPSPSIRPTRPIGILNANAGAIILHNCSKIQTARLQSQGCLVIWVSEASAECGGLTGPVGSQPGISGLPLQTIF